MLYSNNLDKKGYFIKYKKLIFYPIFFSLEKKPSLEYFSFPILKNNSDILNLENILKLLFKNLFQYFENISFYVKTF